jgi:hypothetical protein
MQVGENTSDMLVTLSNVCLSFSFSFIISSLSAFAFCRPAFFPDRVFDIRPDDARGGDKSPSSSTSCLTRRGGELSESIGSSLIYRGGDKSSSISRLIFRGGELSESRRGRRGGEMSSLFMGYLAGDASLS